MTEEVIPEVPVAEIPPEDTAPEQLPTAAPESDEPKPETKAFTQDEVDAIVSKRLAREQRKWERERQAQPSAPREVPPVEQFETPEAYAEALAVKKAEELVQQREMQRQRAEIEEAYHDREDEARSKYDDFEQVAYNPRLPITELMAATIRASDVGPDIAYYLGSNPKEAERIARLAPILQAKEIGKVEAKLATNPPTKKVSNAPSPIAPVTSRSSGSASYETTDPRSIKTMSTSEWIEAERQRQIRKYEQRNR